MLLNSIFRKPTLTKRLFNGSWGAIGHVKREPDTKTNQQLLENIEYYAQQCPEVAKFKKELKQISPEHLGLVSDICELANHTEMLNTSIDTKKATKTGKSLFEFLMEKLPKVSKENPETLELLKAVIDNTDSIVSKHTLRELSSLQECKEMAPHVKATIPLISDIAEATLHGGYTMDFSKAEKFVDSLKSFISPNVELKKLQFLPQIINLADKANALCKIDAFPFLKNKMSLLP